MTQAFPTPPCLPVYLYHGWSPYAVRSRDVIPMDPEWASTRPNVFSFLNAHVRLYSYPLYPAATMRQKNLLFFDRVRGVRQPTCFLLHSFHLMATLIVDVVFRFRNDQLAISAGFNVQYNLRVSFLSLFSSDRSSHFTSSRSHCFRSRTSALL